MAIGRQGERPKLTAKQSRVQMARLAHRVESLVDHLTGVDQAVVMFGSEELEAEAWRTVFDSHDPLDIVARNGLTGCYSTFVNNYIELLKTGAYLAGLTPHKRGNAKDTIELALQDGVITQEQAEHLHELFVFEGRLQHASPDIDADEVRDTVEMLRAVAGGLIKSAAQWLERSGVGPQNS
jgi:hypothetical protein